MRAGHTKRMQRVWVKIGRKVGITKEQLQAAVDAYRDALIADARAGGAIWPRVGVFVIEHRKARRGFKIGMAAGTKETIDIPATWNLALRASRFQRGHGDGPTD